MRFRFTLTHDSDTIEISEPGGWEGGTLKLERDEEFFSLIESYEPSTGGGFIFYGDNGEVNGGVDFIRAIEQSHGFDANILMTVEFAPDDVTFTTIFTGLLDLSGKEEMPDNTMQIPVIQDNLWTKFINRIDTPVDVMSTTTLDGTAVSPAIPVTVRMTPQKLRLAFKRTTGYNPDNTGLFSRDQIASASTAYLIFDNSRNDFDEITERFEYGTQISTEDPTTVKKYIFKATYAGDYRVQASIRYSFIFSSSVDVSSVQFYLAYKNTTDLGLTSYPIGSATGAVASTTHSTGLSTKDIDKTLPLLEGAEVYLYGVIILSAARQITYLPDFDSDTSPTYAPVYTSLQVTADTTLPATDAEGFLIHDLIDAVIKRITT